MRLPASSAAALGAAMAATAAIAAAAAPPRAALGAFVPPGRRQPRRPAGEAGAAIDIGGGIGGGGGGGGGSYGRAGIGIDAGAAQSSSTGTSTSTSLSMGLRSFLKRKLGSSGGGPAGEGDGGNGGGGGESGPGGGAGSGSGGGAVPRAGPARAERERSEARDRVARSRAAGFSSDVTAPPSPRTGAGEGRAVPDTIVTAFSGRSAEGSDETARERIARVKSGQMSEEEKEAFLATALSDPLPRAGDGKGGKPIRQAIPAGGGGGGGGGGRGGPPPRAAVAASAPPGSALAEVLAAAAEKERAEKDRLHKERRLELEEGAKPSNPLLQGQLWSTVGNVPPPAPGRGAAAAISSSESEKQKYLDSVMNPDRFRSYGIKGAVGPASASASASGQEKGAGQPEAAASDGGAGDKASEDGLASRLEAAAIQKETEAQEKRKAKVEQARSDALRREDELKRRHDEIAAKMEKEMEKKREAERERKEKAEQAQREQQARMAEMQRKQDEYWAKKLEDEAAKREERSTAGQSAVANSAKQDEGGQSEPVGSDAALNQANDDSLRARRTDTFMNDTIGLPRAKGSPSSSSFVDQQQQKMDQIERMKEEQLARLSAFSSPLPTPGSAARTMAPSPVPPRPAAPASPPSPAPEVPMPSLAEMTTLKKDPAPAPVPSLADMTRINSNNTGKTNISRNAGAKRVVRQQLPVGDENDYDGDDYLRGGDNLGMSIKDVMSNIGAKKNAAGSGTGDGKDDAERKKAMSWGIDMSKYDDLN